MSIINIARRITTVLSKNFLTKRGYGWWTFHDVSIPWRLFYCVVEQIDDSIFAGFDDMNIIFNDIHIDLRRSFRRA